MSKIRLLVVGAGGHGCSLVEAAKLSGQFEVVDYWMIRYLLETALWG